MSDLATTLPAMLQHISLVIVPLLLALTVHEAAHGLVAWWLGDPTARDAGRLTLNPLKHLDPMGTLLPVMLLATGVRAVIGWAKPVPVNPAYFKNRELGMMLTALAGPGSNVLLGLLFGQILRLIVLTHADAGPGAQTALTWAANAAYYGVFINAALALFNLLPVPPLDGSNILAFFLPARLRATYLSVGRYGLVIVIILALTGLLGDIITPMIEQLADLLLPSAM